MTDPTSDATKADSQKAAAEAGEDALQDLMQSGAAEAAKEQAVTGAESAVAQAESELQAAEAALALADEHPSQTMAPRRLWALRAVLIVNFLLMGVMLALPYAAPEPQPADPHDAAHDAAQHDPHGSGHAPDTSSHFVQPRRDPRYVIPPSKLYNEALKASSKGDYDTASELMHRYIRANSSLHSSLLMGPYLTLAHFLHMAGRDDEAVSFELEAQRMIGASSLPEDLWRAARAAEESGESREMRRAYARLLLQQNMLTPTQYAVVSEAYLKLGESYRMEADEGAAAAKRESDARLREMDPQESKR